MAACQSVRRTSCTHSIRVGYIPGYQSKLCRFLPGPFSCPIIGAQTYREVCAGHDSVGQVAHNIAQQRSCARVVLCRDQHCLVISSAGVWAKATTTAVAAAAAVAVATAVGGAALCRTRCRSPTASLPWGRCRRALHRERASKVYQYDNNDNKDNTQEACIA